MLQVSPMLRIWRVEGQIPVQAKFRTVLWHMINAHEGRQKAQQWSQSPLSFWETGAITLDIFQAPRVPHDMLGTMWVGGLFK